MDIIEQALAEAQRELDKNKGHDFNDKYKVSKLVGHGAFAKVRLRGALKGLLVTPAHHADAGCVWICWLQVMICSHKDTHEKFAVKTVQKNQEDPGKQREGTWTTGGAF
mgnify:CR=1 FL=1